MVVLASHYGKGPIPVRYISETEKLSIDYVEQLFIKLRRSGLIKSIRGVGGGFQLAKPPSKIKIGHIIRCVEELTSLAPCIEDLKKCEPCPRYKDECNIRGLWKKIENKIINILDSTTLKDLCKKK